MKVAIIGAGPRGLWAAEELLERARQRGARIDLSVFNDGPLDTLRGPGAFQPDVPERWLLNVPARVIESQLGSFNAWRGADNAFPPRRQVGDFLLASWRALAAHLPRGCTVEIIEQAVAKVEPAEGGNGGVLVDGAHFDEALLCTGHATPRPVAGAIAAYPHTNLDVISKDDVVLVRGAALSFMDVARYASARLHRNSIRCPLRDNTSLRTRYTRSSAPVRHRCL